MGWIYFVADILKILLQCPQHTRPLLFFPGNCLYLVFFIVSLWYSYHGGSHFYSQMEKVREQSSCEISNGQLLCQWLATLKLWKASYSSDVADTALILRKHTLPIKLFSCMLFNELEIFDPRDQLPFAYVGDMMTPKVRIHMLE